MRKHLLRTAASLMAALIFVMPLTACGDDEESKIPADFGTYGADFARELAQTCPVRKPYSDQERMAGDMIIEEFETLGYDVQTQDFSNIYGGSSRNIYVRIEGQGFVSDGEETDRIAVIGAHYDTALGANDISSADTYDGISDNASGIGCLMTIAKEISAYTDIGFDVIIVAFGAGNDDYTGARHFFNSLSQEEKDSIEVMYCIENIYAGDKMYAHSGMSSLVLSNKYALRRKLYQAYDVAYDRELASTNGYSLLYNESGILIDLNGDGAEDVYREITVNRSDYVVFDEAGIPIVFFDSGDYFFETMEEMRETKNLSLQTYGGKIGGTALDSSELLAEIFSTEESDRLEVRINNTALVIMESLLKGSDHAMTHQEYAQYIEEQRRAAETEGSESEGANVEG